MAITTDELKSLKQRAKKKRDDDDQTWGKIYRDITDYILPSHGRYFDRSNTRDGKLDTNAWSKIVNGSVRRNLGIAVSGWRGYSCPHTLPWFRFSFANKTLNNSQVARKWLQECESITYDSLSNSNFYSSMETVFSELMAFGTGPMLILKDDETIFRCYPWTAGEYVLLSDNTGRVDTAFRWFQMSARAMEQEFGGKKMSNYSKELLRNNPDTLVDMVHAIYPRSSYNPNSLRAENMPYGSCFWEEKSSEGDYLRESGYKTKPFMAPRWEVIGDNVYGTSCPGFEMLGDVKMLQALEKDILRIVAAAASPPVSVPSGLKGGLNMNPGGRNVMTAQQKEAFGRMMDPNLTGLQSVDAVVSRVLQRIREATFNDMFLMMAAERPNKTAYEAARIFEEKMAILTPVIERQNNELYDPMLDRVWDIQMDAGVFPEPPREVSGAVIKVDYVSMLASAQKLSLSVQPLEKWVSFIGGMAQLKPEILDLVNEDEIGREYAMQTNVPVQLIRSSDEIKGLRDERKQQTAQQVGIDQMQQAANAAKSLGAAKMDEGSALGQMMGGGL